jgi:hypothetical protein
MPSHQCPDPNKRRNDYKNINLMPSFRSRYLQVWLYSPPQNLEAILHIFLELAAFVLAFRNLALFMAVGSSDSPTATFTRLFLSA